jgi:hypothetical protein
LKERGLNGVEFVVSDDHAGLKKAIGELLLTPFPSSLIRFATLPPSTGRSYPSTVLVARHARQSHIVGFFRIYSIELRTNDVVLSATEYEVMADVHLCCFLFFHSIIRRTESHDRVCCRCFAT